MTFALPISLRKLKPSLIQGFLWNGKKPKINYTTVGTHTVVGNYSQGGLKLPDLDTIIKSFRVKWMIRIKTEKPSWANVLLIDLKKIGDINSIDANFDM